MMALAAYVDNAVQSFARVTARRKATRNLIKSADKARDQKDWARAADGYAAAILSGATGGLRVQLGHALKEMGDFGGAEQMYRQFLQEHPQDADIHLQLGHLFNKKGELATARTFYERAHELAPENADIAHHFNMVGREAGRDETIRKRDTAMALVAERKWEAARGLLRQLVAIDGETDLIGILANVTKESGRLDEAATLYRGYLRYAESSDKPELLADCHMQLGHLYKIRDDLAGAFKHFLNARNVEHENGYDLDDSQAEGEILSCLQQIYPCFVFRA